MTSVIQLFGYHDYKIHKTEKEAVDNARVISSITGYCVLVSDPDNSEYIKMFYRGDEYVRRVSEEIEAVP